VSAILLIGCANVASLVLVRAMRHRRELAVRSALGASRWALVRYLLVENLLLSAFGLVIGLALAAISLRVLQSAAALQTPLRAAGMEYRLDVRVVAFAVVLTAFAAGVLSLGPVRLLFRTNLQHTLREGSLNATSSRGGSRTQHAFVVIQTACAVTLLVATGLMVKTIARFADVDLGYDAQHVVSVTAVPAHSGRLREKYLPAADRLLPEIAAIPGVESAALRMQVPFAAAKPRAPGVIVVSRDLDEPVMTLDAGRPVDATSQPRSAFGVSADYFTVMGIPLVAGRAFTNADDAAAPLVAIINQWAARHWWPNENPIGRTFSVDTASGIRGVITVVGVVRDNLAGQQSILLAKAGPEVFRPYKQANFWIVNYYVRTHAAAGPIVEQAKAAVMKVVPANGRAQGSVAVCSVPIVCAYSGWCCRRPCD